MTTQEKLELAIKLLNEVKDEMKADPSQGSPKPKDEGGSNPPGPGQPGKP
jgi:hypothetical protein